MKLVFGINDLPYAQRAPVRRIAKPVKGRRRPLKKAAKVASGHQTTADVAQWLENKYGIMHFFADQQMATITGALEDAVKGAIESLAMGAPASLNPYGSGLATIEQAFRDFLDRGGMDGRAGVPTGAALRGVNHRLKRPYLKSNPARQSFIDTGLYQANFRAWIENG